MSVRLGTVSLKINISTQPTIESPPYSGLLKTNPKPLAPYVATGIAKGLSQILATKPIPLISTSGNRQMAARSQIAPTIFLMSISVQHSDNVLAYLTKYPFVHR